MQLGQPVTWDNPDVALFRSGVEQDTYDLVVDTDYDIVVTVHNSSRDKPAPHTRVELRWIEFGAGAQIRHPIDAVLVDVPVWPGTVTATTTWRTPASPGHYCIEVELIYPGDGNPANNRGWNNTQVSVAASPIETPIRIFNRWPAGCPPIQEAGDAVFLPRAVFGTGLLGAVAGWVTAGSVQAHLTVPRLALWGVGGYVVGAVVGLLLELVRSRWRRQRARAPQRDRVPCELVEITVDGYLFQDGKGKDVDPSMMFAPRPPAWPARVEPPLFQFLPGEAYRDVLLLVEAPDVPGPPEVFNVNVRQGNAPTGGVTVTVELGG
jgi:hypothetical protein